MPVITLPSGFVQLERRIVARGGNRDWYRIENSKDPDEATVYIYDEIGYWGTTAQQFVKDLQAVKAGTINLHLNTPGGDVFDGIAIHNALRQHSATVHVQVDALAASIGSVIAMAGDRITMAKHSTMMIHDPFGYVVGNAEDMRKMSEVLDGLGDTIAGVYAERAGGSVREWRDRMLEETWYSDREAVDVGLADQVDGDSQAQAAFDLSMFRHPPERLAASAASPPASGQPTKRDIEKALRDAGLSRVQAKALIASGWGAAAEETGSAERDAAELLALRDALKIAVQQGENR
jgi:ATP-dependent protease ClpP protease subunit